MMSLDVISLFTNVPLNLVLTSIERRWHYISPSTKLSLDQFIYNYIFIINWFKNRLRTCCFADRQFFSISNPERFFSSLKKTIVLYLVKKFETFMVICTSRRRCVFFKKRFCISASRTIYLTLNLQARHYRNINYYNIYICIFTQFYLSMFREKKIECCLLLHSDLF